MHFVDIVAIDNNGWKMSFLSSFIVSFVPYVFYFYFILMNCASGCSVHS